MKTEARFDHGSPAGPAYQGDAAERVLQRTEGLAERYGRGTVTIAGQRLVVRRTDGGHATCVLCARPTAMIYAVGRGGTLCGACTRELMHQHRG